MTYDPMGDEPKKPRNVVIKVALQNRMVYVMEGNRPLLVAATAIGTPSNPTPRGRFRVTRKIENRRSNTYGFWAKGDNRSRQELAAAGLRLPLRRISHAVPGEWIACIWIPRWIGLPVPRSHGCLRLHQNAARDFFTLARVGTPVYIGKLNLKTRPGARTLHARTITTIPIR
jgi:lipoprotein-anchoring transpeptidase ErfK/SrfK